MACYLDLQKDLGQRAIDLGAGVGLTCLVLARRGVDVTCTDVDDAAIAVAAQNAQSFVDRSSVAATVRIGRFNYSTPPDTWQRQGVIPPYDTVVMGATPQGELRSNLADFSKLFRSLGRPGAHIYIEDQGHQLTALAAPSDEEAPEVFGAHGLSLVDAFDPLERGLWPMPRGRIYCLKVLQ